MRKPCKKERIDCQAIGRPRLRTTFPAFYVGTGAPRMIIYARRRVQGTGSEGHSAIYFILESIAGEERWYIIPYGVQDGS